LFNRTLKDRVKQLEFELFYKDQSIKELTEQVAALSIQKDPKNPVSAINYELYDNKVLSKIGNAMLSGTDNPAFKLGIQFACRHFEKELVIGR
jgi:hypothetical protein